MRLLKTTPGRPEFQTFYGDDTPFYAILSHTWGPDEVTYQDALQYDLERLSTTAGYQKIDKTRAVAALHGLEWAWIDTCCIDKTSSAELSEAINSMYQWYQQAAICYAYLSDVHLSGMVNEHPKSLAASRWFTRGWTLQELIAPGAVIFYDTDWQEIGTKASLSPQISRITGIPQEILVGSQGPETASIARRMSWASRRETTRLEDTAYCLMGLFGVNMPMLYGERERAFIRLQEEIIKISNDHSLFAWEGEVKLRHSFLATSPWAFARSSDIVPQPSDHGVGDITVSRKGIHLDVDRLVASQSSSKSEESILMLPCWSQNQQVPVGIVVNAVPGTNNYFVRTNFTFIICKHTEIEKSRYLRERICVYQERQPPPSSFPLAKAAEQGNERMFSFLVEKGVRKDSRMLHRAVESGHTALVKLLLESGMDWDALDIKEYTTIALKNGHYGVYGLLVGSKLRDLFARGAPSSSSTGASTGVGR